MRPNGVRERVCKYILLSLWMTMPLLCLELGQKFSFPMKAIKNSSTGGRCWGVPWPTLVPPLSALASKNPQTSWASGATAGRRYH